MNANDIHNTGRRCEDRDCHDKVEASYHAIFGTQRYDGLKDDVTMLKSNTLPRWAKVILTSCFIGMLAAALVVWADAKSLPTKLKMYANQIKATETTANKNSESIQDLTEQVNKLSIQQGIDTTKILNAIYRLKTVKPMDAEIPDGLSGANNK